MQTAPRSVDSRLLATVVREHVPFDGVENADHLRALAWLEHAIRPLDRECFEPGHAVGSAFAVAPSTQRVALIHHAGLQRWLQPGGITLHDRILDQAEHFAEALKGLGLASISVTSPIAQGRAEGSAHLYRRLTEPGVTSFANRLAAQVDCPTSLRIPRCDSATCPSGSSVFAMGPDGAVSDCPDVGATNVCRHAPPGALA